MGMVTLDDIDRQLRNLCVRRQRCFETFDIVDLLAVSTLIDGWLAARTAIRSTTRQDTALH
jgi:hypothetical protein